MVENVGENQEKIREKVKQKKEDNNIILYFFGNEYKTNLI